jgi:hypothetical protein
MDKRYIEENEIEVKYLRNQLDPDELEEFEVYLMENPEMVDHIELDQIISSSLKDESSINSLKEEANLWNFASLTSRCFSSVSVISQSIAMLVIVTLSGIWWVGIVDDSSARILTQVRNFAQRDLPINEIPISSLQLSAVGWMKIELFIENPMPNVSTYSLKITPIEDQPLDKDSPIYSLEKASLDSDGFVRVLLHSRDLVLGKYIVELGDNTKQYFYNFEVVEKN